MDEKFHDEALECSPTAFDHCYELPLQPPPTRHEDEDYMEVPLSPDSKKYKMKMSLLQEKYDEIQSNNEMLRNRVMEVKKEITQHERLKRVLVYSLESRGDKYYKAALEFPPPKEMPKPMPSKEDLEKERRRRERKERDRLREKARKQARKELLARANLDTKITVPGTDTILVDLAGPPAVVSTLSVQE